ncbi:unnamed protein product [Sphacelaria rigidula]
MAIKPSSGIALQELGELDEAATCYEKAIALAPDYVLAHYNLAYVRQDQGRLMEAAQHFRVAADLDPSDVDIHISLGNVLRQDGEAAGAIK